jgi:hypothetical protein
MTPEQAIQVIESLANTVSLPRSGHAQVDEAIAVLRESVGPEDVPEDPGE